MKNTWSNTPGVTQEGDSRLLQTNKIYQGDVLKVLKTFPDESIHCCVTSPPYWRLRDYGVEAQETNLLNWLDEVLG